VHSSNWAGCIPTAAAAILLSACDPALGPEPRHAPKSVVVVETVSRTGGGEYDQLLRAMNAGQPVNAEQRKIILVLAGRLARMSSNAGVGAAMNPALSPAAERALREVAALPRDEATMRRVLERLAAESARQDPQ
jgi:hypothetical protein